MRLWALLTAPGYAAQSRVRTGRWAVVESYLDPTPPDAAAQVERALRRAAQACGVTEAQLDALGEPPLRVRVMAPSAIQEIGEKAGLLVPGGVGVHALYYPQARLVLTRDFDAGILTHELTHYLQDQVLHLPRAQWERGATAAERA